MAKHNHVLPLMGLILIISCLTQPIATQAHDVKVKVGAPWLKSRRQLVQAGWQPAPKRVEEAEALIGVERLLYEAGYTEVSNCAMDIALCQLNYRRGSKCLTLWVKGEEPAEMSVTQMAHSCRGFAPTVNPASNKKLGS